MFFLIISLLSKININASSSGEIKLFYLLYGFQISPHKLMKAISKIRHPVIWVKAAVELLKQE